MYKKLESQLNNASWYTGFMGGDGKYSYRKEARLYLEVVEVREPVKPSSKASKRGVQTICLGSGNKE